VSVIGNSVIGAMIRKDGQLQPVEGEDPSAEWTYRPEEPEEPEPKDDPSAS
jgi:hypothetical protein